MLVVAGVVFVAAAVTDILGMAAIAVTKHYAIRNSEVVFNGLAQGSLPQGIRDQIGNQARNAWAEAQRNSDSGKGPTN